LTSNPSTNDLIRLKCDLYSRGISIGEKEEREITQGGRIPLIIRKGISEGIELRLSESIFVNAPVNPHWSMAPFQLEIKDDGIYSISCFNDIKVPIEVLPRPQYYQMLSPSGIPLMRVAQTFTDRVSVSPGCTCWLRRCKHECRFCYLGSRDFGERVFSHDDIVFAVGKAMVDPVLPARHILISGGTIGFEREDFCYFISLVHRLKQSFGMRIYLMTCPPRELVILEQLKEAGLDEIAMNIEFYGRNASEKFTPGKALLIGKDKYIDALAKAVEVFGKHNVRSILITGVEPTEITLEGVRVLSSLGVTPILSPFRPVHGIPMEKHPVISGDEFYSILTRADKIARDNGSFLGPPCKACRNNTLNL